MVERSQQFLFWWYWLLVATIGLNLFGLVLVLAPSFTRQLVGLLSYGSAMALNEFAASTADYITSLMPYLAP